MKYITYILLGIIQGITEPLPISSSGHIYLFKNIFNTNIFNDLNFEVFVNFGSFIAIFIIFLPTIIKLSLSFIKYIINNKKNIKHKENYKYCNLLILSTIPTCIIGLLFKDKLESLLSIKLICISLLITALSLFLIKNKQGYKEDKDITKKDALIISIFQTIALIPGISRSGSTLVGCLLCNIKKENALKYTFLLYIPISIATMLLGIIDLLKNNNYTSLLIPYTIGLITSTIATYITYNKLNKLVIKNKLWYFSIYCILLSLFVMYWFR